MKLRRFIERESNNVSEYIEFKVERLWLKWCNFCLGWFMSPPKKRFPYVMGLLIIGILIVTFLAGYLK